MSQPDAAKGLVAQEQGSSSISAAAQAYQTAMEQQSTTSSAPVADSSTDVVMADSAPMERAIEAASPAILSNVANAPSPIPGRMGTPQRTNGTDATSRATSQHPEPVSTMPKEAPPNGAPTRQYLNSQVTGPLMEGMKAIAKEKPKDPLRALGEFLLQKSRELEGT